MIKVVDNIKVRNRQFCFNLFRHNCLESEKKNLMKREVIVHLQARPSSDHTSLQTLLGTNSSAINRTLILITLIDSAYISSWGCRHRQENSTCKIYQRFHFYKRVQIWLYLTSCHWHYMYHERTLFNSNFLLLMLYSWTDWHWLNFTNQVHVRNLINTHCMYVYYAFMTTSKHNPTQYSDDTA
jgi:hypothetical protein